MKKLILLKLTTSQYKPELKKVMGDQEIVFYQNLVKSVPVADNVIKYAVNLVTSTRPHSASAPKYINDWINWGAGPRASQYLILGAKARAIIDGRFTPEIEDIRRSAIPVLRHRLILNFNAEADNIKVEQIIKKTARRKISIVFLIYFICFMCKSSTQISNL